MAILDPGQMFAILLVVIVIVLSTWIFLRGNIAMCHSQKDLTGKTVMVTGANCGIGYFTALDFAKRNARVILACRSEERAEAAMAKIIAESGNTNITISIIDLSSMRSIRNFAELIQKEETHLDILVNNAGIASRSKEITEDGLETVFATNHFGPFLLTNLLLDLLKASAPSRVVTVSSMVHRYGSIEFDNLQGEKSFSYRRRYFDSKLCNILFTRVLAEKLEGTGVTANVLHPGTVATEFLRNQPFLVKLIAIPFMKVFCKTGEEGAQTSIYLALSEDVKDINGKYFTECALDEAGAVAESRDVELARKLWDVSAKLTGLDLS